MTATRSGTDGNSASEIPKDVQSAGVPAWYTQPKITFRGKHLKIK